MICWLGGLNEFDQVPFKHWRIEEGADFCLLSRRVTVHRHLVDYSNSVRNECSGNHYFISGTDYREDLVYSKID